MVGVKISHRRALALFPCKPLNILRIIKEEAYSSKDRERLKRSSQSVLEFLSVWTGKECSDS